MRLGPLQRLWLRRLASGQYAQGKLRLCTITSAPDPAGYCDAKFCCLGVACEVYIDRVEPLPFSIPSLSSWYLYLDKAVIYCSSASHMPQRVTRALGFRSNHGRYTGALANKIKATSKHKLPDAIKKWRTNIMGGKFLSLADMNDNGVPFKDIAEIIRFCPEAFFTKTA